MKRRTFLGMLGAFIAAPFMPRMPVGGGVALTTAVHPNTVMEGPLLSFVHDVIIGSDGTGKTRVALFRNFSRPPTAEELMEHCKAPDALPFNPGRCAMFSSERTFDTFEEAHKFIFEQTKGRVIVPHIHPEHGMFRYCAPPFDQPFPRWRDPEAEAREAARLYVCPACSAERTYDEFTDFDEGDDDDSFYTYARCPRCDELIPLEELEPVNVAYRFDKNNEALWGPK